MSVKLEWIGAECMAVVGLLPGDEAVDGQEIEGDAPMGVQIYGDDGAVVVGTPEELRGLARQIIEEVDAAERRLTEREA